MKKIITSICTLAHLLIVSLSFAQAPQKMSCQAVIRNPSNTLVMNTTVGMQISILQGSPMGTAVYVETQTPTTNSNGLASLEIGTGVVVTGTFNTINWASGGPFYIKTETDPLGGVAYTITGTTQMLSVPYAMYAEKSGGLSMPIGKTYLTLNGDITDAEAATKIANEVGPNTQYVLIENTTVLTTVDLSGITELMEIFILNNAMLNSVNLNNITKVNKAVNCIGVYNNPSLTNFSMPSLNAVSSNIQMSGNTNLASISFPALVKNNNSTISLTGLPSLSSINFNSLSKSGFIQLYGPSLLTSITFPQLMHSSDIVCSYHPLLTNINLPSFNSVSNGLDFRSNNLSTATVNSLLNQMLSVTPTSGKYLYLNVQSPLAPPSGAGITAKATLISNGQTITTD